jgi:Ca2+/Na+ antiporter
MFVRNDNVRAGSSLPVADFIYDRKWIMRSTLFLAVAVVWIMLLIVFLLPFDPIVTIVMGAALVVFFIVVGMSPFWTEHSIEENEIVLRQGWHFSVRIPLENVKAINFIEDAPKDRSLFISQTRGMLNITASKRDLISLRLRRPQRIASVFWRKADEIVFDVADREGFRQAFEKALIATHASPVRAFLY